MAVSCVCRPAHLLAGVPRVAPYSSQRHPSSFVVSSTGQAYCSVHSSTPLADSPTRRRGKKSLLIRRDATLRIAGALHLGIFDQPGKQWVFANMEESL